MFGKKKQKIDKKSDDSGRPYANLIPIVQALVEAGNYTRNADYFIKTQGGPECWLRDPIDFNLVRKRFKLPENVGLYERDDAISDRLTWAAIRGGRGEDA